MTSVKVALIGAGKMASTVHYPALTSFPEVEIVGLCDLDDGRLEEAARKFGIARTFHEYRRMLDETQPDAVYALMPPHHLFDVAADVLERGKHLFIEKPPGVTTFQTECLARLADQQDVVTSVGFQRRYHPLVRRCWEEVKRKGPVHQTVACFYKNTAPGDRHPYFRGAIDILRCDAIHAVDALRYYCGLSPVKSVASEVRNLDGWYANSFNAIVHFENDSVGVLLANWRTGRRFVKFEFHSCGASAFADTDGQGEVWVDNQRDPLLALSCTKAAGAQEEHRVQGFWAENRAFIDAILQGGRLHNSLPDAVETMRLADAIYNNAITS